MGKEVIATGKTVSAGMGQALKNKYADFKNPHQVTVGFKENSLAGVMLDGRILRGVEAVKVNTRKDKPTTVTIKLIAQVETTGNPEA